MKIVDKIIVKIIEDISTSAKIIGNKCNI